MVIEKMINPRAETRRWQKISDIPSEEGALYRGVRGTESLKDVFKERVIRPGGFMTSERVSLTQRGEIAFADVLQVAGEYAESPKSNYILQVSKESGEKIGFRARGKGATRTDEDVVITYEEFVKKGIIPLERIEKIYIFKKGMVKQIYPKAPMPS